MLKQQCSVCDVPIFPWCGNVLSTNRPAVVNVLANRNQLLPASSVYNFSTCNGHRCTDRDAEQGTHASTTITPSPQPATTACDATILTFDLFADLFRGVEPVLQQRKGGVSRSALLSDVIGPIP